MNKSISCIHKQHDCVVKHSCANRAYCKHWRDLMKHIILDK